MKLISAILFAAILIALVYIGCGCKGPYIWGVHDDPGYAIWDANGKTWTVRGKPVDAYGRPDPE